MRRSLVDLSMLLIAWLAMATSIGVAGDFPLNDDWSYAITVQRLLNEGSFHPTDWTSMPLLTHALWGALFCLPNGFSFEALRLSTLVLGMLGVAASYGLLREIGAGRAVCLIGAAGLGFNPLWTGLSFTFMTDVPFVALTTLALLLFLRSLRTGSRPMAVLGTIAMSVAVLNRQLGLFVAVAYAAGRMRRDGCSPRVLLRALSPLAIGIVLLLGLQLWLQMHDVLPSEYSVKSRAMLQVLTEPIELLDNLLHGIFVVVPYLGLFLLPVLLLTPEPSTPRSLVWLGRLTTIVLAVLLLATGKTMPLGFNILTPAGVGPDALRDVYILGVANRAPLPPVFWIAITALAVLGAGLLVTRLLAGGHRARRGAPIDEAVLRVALLAGSFVYLAPILMQSFLDRYLVVLIPVLAAALAVPAGPEPVPAPSRARLLGSLLALAPLLLLAVLGTHDWLERCRMRWQALHWLQEQGISAQRIDGGFEFHGLHTYDAHFRARQDHSWWWVHDDEYVIGMGPLPGYEQVRSFAVERWLPPTGEQIVVLQRLPVATPPR